MNDKKIFLVKGNIVSIPIAKLPNDRLMRTYLEGEWEELTPSNVSKIKNALIIASTHGMIVEEELKKLEKLR